MKQSAMHKRLMLLGTLGGLMWPAITRLPCSGRKDRRPDDFAARLIR